MTRGDHQLPSKIQAAVNLKPAQALGLAVPLTRQAAPTR